MTYLDDEVSRIKDDYTGQYSDEDRAAAESWRLTWESRWSAETRSQAAEREADKTARQARLYEDIRASQKQADENRAALQAGDMTVADFLNASARLEAKAAHYERRLQGLERAETIIDEMRGAPVEWRSNFFEKWSVLRHTRPNLDEWIHEARIKRRNASRTRSATK